MISRTDAYKYQELDGFLRIRRPVEAHHPQSAVAASELESDTDSEGVTGISEDEGISLTSHQLALRDIEAALASHPLSSEHWLSLLSRTLQTAPVSSRNSSKTRAELTLSVIERAFSFHQNRASKVLRLKYLKAGEEVWDADRISKEWQEAFEQCGSVLWMEWFEWRITQSNSTVDTITEAATDIFGKIGAERSECVEIARLRAFWRVAVAFQQAGVNELP
jgi:hypothetical protein